MNLCQLLIEYIANYQLIAIFLSRKTQDSMKINFSHIHIYKLFFAQSRIPLYKYDFVLA